MAIYALICFGVGCSPRNGFSSTAPGLRLCKRVVDSPSSAIPTARGAMTTINFQSFHGPTKKLTTFCRLVRLGCCANDSGVTSVASSSRHKIRFMFPPVCSRAPPTRRVPNEALQSPLHQCHHLFDVRVVIECLNSGIYGCQLLLQHF